METRKAIPRLFFLLLSIWGLINILQATFTELEQDETYYWMYSRFLDWGYFDHPPMIALMIKPGTILFEGNLGVRCMVVFAQLVCLIITWKLINLNYPNKQQVLAFFILAASIVMFEVYGFIATPDAPLLLFTALFLWMYARFLEKESGLNTALLGLSMALLLYSKYHGILIIGFTLLSNTRLLRSSRFWMASATGVLLFTPHLLWQAAHDFPSFRYHLFTRARPTNIKHILEYIPNQLLSFNPLFLAFACIVLIKARAQDRFERALFFTVIGFFCFFFVSAFRGHVEPHWTIAATIPLLILVTRRVTNQSWHFNYVRMVLLPTIIILLIVRAGVIFNFLPVKMKFQGRKAWTEHLATIAGDTPVVFRNSYQLASAYTYYTGHESTSLNGFYYRKNQYDYWPNEEHLFGKEVILVTHIKDPLAEKYLFPNGKYVYLHRTKEFFSIQKLKLKYSMPSGPVFHAGDTVSMRALITNPYTYTIPFDKPYFPITCQAMFVKNGNDMTVVPVSYKPVIDQLSPGEERQVMLKFEVPDLCTREYEFALTLKAGIHEETFSSTGTTITVLEK